MFAEQGPGRGWTTYSSIGRFVELSKSKQDLIDAMTKGADHEELFGAQGLVVFEQVKALSTSCSRPPRWRGEVRSDISTPDLIGLTLGPCLATGNPFVAGFSPDRMLSIVRAGLSL